MHKKVAKNWIFLNMKILCIQLSNTKKKESTLSNN